MLIEAVVPFGESGSTGSAADEGPSRVVRGSVAAASHRLASLGVDGLVAEETKDSPFTVLAAAAEATDSIRLSTSVAIAFARSPAVAALDAWTLQRVSGGRFTLGLGSQIRQHIERRYGMPWSDPAPRMREYVLAVRSLWSRWQEGEGPGFVGDHYRSDLMVPLFDPGPVDHPRIPVHLAAVNPLMCRVAGEVADGIRCHPACTSGYIGQTLLPEARRSAARAGRDPAQFEVAVKPLIAYAVGPESLEHAIRQVRSRLAFYAATPVYRPAFAHHGDAEVADAARVLARERRWSELPGLIDDEFLDRYAFVGTPERVGARLVECFGPLATRCEIPVASDEAALTALPRLLTAIRAIRTDRRVRTDPEEYRDDR